MDILTVDAEDLMSCKWSACSFSLQMKNYRKPYHSHRLLIEVQLGSYESGTLERTPNPGELERIKSYRLLVRRAVMCRSKYGLPQYQLHGYQLTTNSSSLICGKMQAGRASGRCTSSLGRASHAIFTVVLYLQGLQFTTINRTRMMSLSL